MSIKSVALKDAILVFVATVAVHFAWNLISARKVGVGMTLAVSAGAAFGVYFYKRKDLFD
jgi:hypothetical protein